ncbi:HAMP domain-containing sensor histidine kinase [Bacteroides sp.]|uniref:sensor histidine kinase n=1 Tax=Bacteroides sp. TaxID=29523 RepID=UPI00261C182D|nr:HAMP domain-containing sensor histidine kinase [Bacteroides sp.]
MKILLLLFIILFYSSSTLSNNVQADSLKAVFVHAKTQKERMSACLNLDNYYRNYLFIDSLPLTRVLLEEGIKAKDEYIISDALRKLVMSINRKKRVLTNDSVIYYLNLANEVLTGERKRSFIAEVRLRHIRSIADWTEDENQVIEQLSAKYNNSNENPEDIYFQIERNYALGMAAALGISNNGVDTYKNALRYFERLFELIQKVPVKYGAEILFWVNENIYIGYINSKENTKVVAFLEKMMDILERYQELPEVKADIYQNFEYANALYNEGLSRFPTIVGYQKALDCLKKAEVMLRQRNNLLSFYFTIKGFYEDMNDYKMIILYGDSIIDSINNDNTPTTYSVCASVYKDQAESYAALKNYKKAYELMLANSELQEKITNEESQQLRADMDARYDLGHLELEKEKLTSRNRQIAFFSILFVFVLSVAWGISQRFHLNKLKRMQKKLMESNDEVIRQSEKAQESEKMKTAFINSMCHEIRTPLNAINGFSSLLLDETIDAECKHEFPELIQSNTDLLTGLLNDLLEVSNLSSSVEELPTAQADILEIFTEEMRKLKSTSGKDSIHYCLDVADDCHEIRTNVIYLSQTIAHLLSNANKFTESGQITLSCHKDKNGKLEMRVTDTGVGIPVDKQEWVFDRFTKIDDFKPGNGLGLYISRLIVTRLGGTIHIDSGYTDGTSFVINI